MNTSQIKSDLSSLANPAQAAILSRFFKTEKGQYGEGDVFIGVKVPEQRKIAQKYKDADLKTIQTLLRDPIHEVRSTALLILTYKFPKETPENQQKIITLYLKNTAKINNWDLVDLSAPKLLGTYLLKNPQDRKILYKLAKSSSLWERRIAILSTYTFIKNNEHEDTLAISKILLHDKHDLIHKAVGWMLREVWNTRQKANNTTKTNLTETFIQKHYKEIPRTMLRYAIEKFPEKKRRKYLKKDT